MEADIEFQEVQLPNTSVEERVEESNMEPLRLPRRMLIERPRKRSVCNWLARLAELDNLNSDPREPVTHKGQGEPAEDGTEEVHPGVAGKRKALSSTSPPTKRRKGESANPQDLSIQVSFLQSMFPYADAAILKRRLSAVNDGQDFGMLVADLLSGDPEDPSLFPESQDELRFPISQDLLREFIASPLADPEYLKERLKTNHNLDNPPEIIYRSRESAMKQQYLEKLRINDADGFDVKAFLDEYPNPWTYFNDRSRNVDINYIFDAIDYLIHRYRSICATCIWKSFAENHLLLYQTANELDDAKPCLKEPRKTPAWNTMSVLSVKFLYEVVFLENEKMIAEGVSSRKEPARKRMKLAIDSLSSCEFCLEKYPEDETFSCGNRHSFCAPCVQRRADVHLGKGQRDVTCLEANCGAKFTLETLRRALKPVAFTQIVRRRQLEELTEAGVAGLELCVCPNCGFSIVLPREDDAFQCPHPLCSRISCRLCIRKGHRPRACCAVIGDARQYFRQ